MFEQIKKTFSPPVFPDNDDKTRAALYGNWIILLFMGLVLATEISGKMVQGDFTFNILDAALFTLFVLLFVAWVLLKNGYVNQANILLVSLMWTISNLYAFLGFGVRDSAYIANFIIILAAGLLLGWRAASILTAVTILTGFGLAYAETHNLSPTAYYSVSANTARNDMTSILVVYAIFIFLLFNGWDSAIKSAKRGKNELEISNRELLVSQSMLEKNQRDLLTANQELVHRNERVNAVAEISNKIATINNIEDLLVSIVHTISRKFGYYHVGIFLLDEGKQFAVLRAANSDGGKNMLTRGHRLRVGAQGIVGYVTYSGIPRIALDVGEDAAFFNNPDLPETHSEVTLPIKFGNEIVGALDIQSKETNAFTKEDVEVLSILTNQVSVAIQNAFSLDQARRALQEAEFATSQLTGIAWKEYAEKVRTKGYRYDGLRPEPLKGSVSSSSESDSTIIPVQLRGQTIGRLKLKTSDSSRKLTDDEIAIVESTADRVALAFDSARLLDDAQKRATRESFLSEIGSKLSTSFQLDTILRDTVEELGQNLKDSTVTFQLVNPSSPMTMDNNDENKPSLGRKTE
ncbi:MAG: GAF domain-containing protein [Anaerolineales bacterium]|nr:GAF domain-containing protein [Anaerolineales bacterium]